MHKFNHNGHYDSCVADVVKKIVDAQNKVRDEERDDCCSVSCQGSIDQLLSPTDKDQNRRRNNTIPFVLFSKGKLKPFIGSGFKTIRGRFVCIESPVFRAKQFVDYDCIELELLLPASEGSNHHEHHCNCGRCKYCEQRQSRQFEHVDGNDHNVHRHDSFEHLNEQDMPHQTGHYHHTSHGWLCDFFQNQHIHNFQTTGVCMTVDLNSFSAISCLDAIRPVSS